MIETKRLILRKMSGDCELTMQSINGFIRPEIVTAPPEMSVPSVWRSIDNKRKDVKLL